MLILRTLFSKDKELLRERSSFTNIKAKNHLDQYSVSVQKVTL